MLRVGVGVLRVAEEVTVEAGDSSRLPNGPDLDGPLRLKGNLRGLSGTYGAHDRERHPGRLRSGLSVDTTSRHTRASRQPEPALQGSFGTDGSRPRRSELRP